MRKAFDYTSQIREQTCKCGRLYPAKWFLIIDQWHDTTSGNCPDCHAKWEIDYEKRMQDIRDAEVKKENNEQRVRFRSKESKIPLYYQSKTFLNINTHVNGNMKKVCPECMKYADSYPLDYLAYWKKDGKAYPSLLIASPKAWGVGKTHLVCAILHRVLDRWDGTPRRCPVLFTTEPEIYLRIQNTYSFNNQERESQQSEADIIQELANIPLLAIDDIGKQKRSDMKFVQRTLFSIINGRYDNMRPTIMTTNMGLEQLEVYLGGNDNCDFDRASFDRLLEMCKGNFWLLEGESQRSK